MRAKQTDIRLEAPIRETLNANYVGSLAVLRLAARMARLRSFVYISTCYTNMNRPRGSHVEERCVPPFSLPSGTGRRRAASWGPLHTALRSRFTHSDTH